MNRVLKFRLPETLAERIDAVASRTARTRSDLARESLAIGFETVARRAPGDDDNPPQAA
jgi:predicted DNA-binding protein